MAAAIIREAGTALRVRGMRRLRARGGVGHRRRSMFGAVRDGATTRHTVRAGPRISSHFRARGGEQMGSYRRLHSGHGLSLTSVNETRKLKASYGRLVTMMKASTNSDCAGCSMGQVSSPCPMHEVVHPAGTVLLEQGIVTSQVWLVQRGTVLLSTVDPGGEEVLCALRGPGALLGLEVLRGDPSPMQAWALSEVRVCGVDVAELRRWMGSRTSPMGAILELALTEAGRRGAERMALAGRAVSRLARFLLERRRLEGRDRPLLVSHNVLARMLGMRAETLSRALAKLREAGAVGLGPTVRVTDPVRLESFAGDAVEAESAA